MFGGLYVSAKQLKPTTYKFMKHIKYSVENLR